MIYNAFEYLKVNPQLIGELNRKIRLFEEYVQRNNSFCHPIRSLVEAGNDNVKALENKLNDNGFNVKAILSPTVAEGSERLRICIHTFNSDTSIIALAKELV